MTTHPIQAAVVGLGHSALTVIAALNQRGITPTVFSPDERVGKTWRNRYEALRLNTDAASSAIPSPAPSHTLDRWPTGHQWADYLAEVAEHLDFERRRTEVRSITRNNQHWTITTADSEHTARNVVVATGRDHVAYLPSWPGLSDTNIAVVHSSSFRNSQDFKNMNVLVVGNGNSGTEIAHLLTQHASNVAISIRARPVFVRRETFGVGITQVGRLAKHIPHRVLDRGARALQRLQMGDLSKWGLGPPELSLSGDLVHRQGPTVDSGFLADVKSGSISVVSDIECFTAHEVVLADHARLKPDTVIAATGYRTGLAELVPHDVLDSDGWPQAATPPYQAAPGLFFAGFAPASLTAFMPDFIEYLPAIADAISDANT